MIKIKRGGVVRRVPKSAWRRKYRHQGYEIVEDEKSKLDKMTYQDLYELAQDKELPGRSGMTADELRQALKEVV